MFSGGGLGIKALGFPGQRGKEGHGQPIYKLGIFSGQADA